MPKSNLCLAKEINASRSCRISLCFNIRKRMKTESISLDALAFAAEIKPDTLRKKLSDDGDCEKCVFTSEQLVNIFRKLRFRDYEIMESMSEVIK